MENLNAEREQIKKAYEHCNTTTNCKGCPYEHNHKGGVTKCPINTDVHFLLKELTEENESLSQSLANSKSILANSKADTVRKMQERFIAEIEQTPNANEHFIKAWKEKIDQIAKEMLEGIKNND